MAFGIADYIVFAASIVVALAIGVYHGWRIRNRSTALEYHLGNKALQTFPLALSVLVTTQSSITMLGIPAEAYLYGGMIAWTGVGFCLAHFIAARVLIPLYHPLNLTTASEYYQLRYNGRAVRLFTCFCNILLNALYMGIVTFGQAVSMEAVTKIPTALSIVIVISVAVIYTSMGGLKAVVWTDVFQCITMFAGIFAVLIKGTVDAGGASKVWQASINTNRLNVFEASPDPYIQYTVWGSIFGLTAKLSFSVVKQSAIQRINACKTKTQAQIVFLLAGPAFILIIALASAEGLVAYAYYSAKRCDPLKSRQISNPNQLIPQLVVDIFEDYPGVPGLFLAAVASASLSTLSSCLSSMSSMTQMDFIRPFFPKISESKGTFIAKISVLFYGAISLGVAFLVSFVSGSIINIINSLISVFGVPLIGAMYYSIFFPSATQLGTILGGIIGGLFVFTLTIVNKTADKKAPLEKLPFDFVDTCSMNSSNDTTLGNITTTLAPVTSTEYSPKGFEYLYHLSSYWYDLIGLVVFLVVAVSVSFSLKIEGRYMFSVVERFFCCLPKNVRKKLCCGNSLEEKRKFDEKNLKENSPEKSDKEKDSEIIVVKF